MRPTKTFLTAFLLLTAGTVLAADDAKDKAMIQGTWQVTAMEANGKTAPEEYAKNVQFVISEDKMVLTLTRNGATNKKEFSYKIDPTTKPKSLDISPTEGPDKGKSGAAIYELDGDTLKLCLPNGETKSRPAEFKAPKGSNLGLFTMKRVKP